MPSGICARCGLFSQIHLLWESSMNQWVCPDCYKSAHGAGDVPTMPCWRCRKPIRADLMFNQRGRVVCYHCRSIMRQMEEIERTETKTLEEYA